MNPIAGISNLAIIPIRDHAPMIMKLCIKHIDLFFQFSLLVLDYEILAVF